MNELTKLICDCMSSAVCAVTEDNANNWSKHVEELVNSYNKEWNSSIDAKAVSEHLCDIVIANHLDTI